MAGDRHLDPDDDTTLPQEPELAELAHQGELAATGLPASTVRRLGTRRRRRRHAAVGAGALALVVLAGGIAVGSTGTLFTQEPPVVATPTPAPTTVATSGPSTSGRSLTETQLLQVGDIPVESDTQRVEIAPDGVGRSVGSVCVPDGGPARLGATATRERNFRYVITDPEFSPDPTDPSTGQPTYYTQALQFADPDAAAAAERRYAAWLDDCRTTMAAKDFTLIGGGAPTIWTDVAVDRSATQTGNTVGRFATVTTYREPGDRTENGWFESVGLTQVDDTMMVTVRVVYGMDDNVSLQPGGDPANGIPAEPQFTLIPAATKRLPR